MKLIDVFNKDESPCLFTAPISYETFKEIGWTVNDFLYYRCLCDDIRSAAIASQFVGKIDSKAVRNHQKLEKDLILNRVKSLFEFLQSFSEEPLPEFQQNYLYFIKYIRYGSLARADEYNENPSPYIVYLSKFHYISIIEQFVSIVLHNKKFTIIKEPDFDQLSVKELKQKLFDLKTKTIERSYPEFPKDFNDIKIGYWGEKMIYYESYLDQLEEIEECEDALYEKTGPDFQQSSNILFVYSGSNIICNRNKHNVISVNCKIKLPEGHEVINAMYCHDCREFFISEDSYNYYKDLYGLLPLKIRFTNEDGGFTPKLEFRAQKSPLNLVGYNVEQRNGLSDEERFRILVFIIKNGILSKQDIINYLELFININGERAKMNSAVQKWNTDLARIRSYNMEKQETYLINDIERY